MRTFFGFVAVVSLFSTVALIPVLGAILFAFVTFGLFLLGLVGVLASLDDRSVGHHDAVVDPTRWRRGSWDALAESSVPAEEGDRYSPDRLAA